MTAHSLRLNHLIRNRRGFSAVIATIFMVLVVLFLYFNVFMFIQNQDIKFQDAISQSQQLDVDRNAERVTIANIQPAVIGSDQVTITCTFINNSSLPVKITRVWIKDLVTGNVGNSTLSPLPLVLSPGEITVPQTFTVSIQSPSGWFYLQFVTSRGNLVSSNIP